jgi:uncharacterized protein
MICRFIVLPLALAALASPGFAAGPTSNTRRSVPLTDVRITDDAFWAPKLKVYRERTVPHSWHYVRREIEDNEVAAGWKRIERGKDTPWNQANLHKVLETCAYALAQEPNPELDKKLDYLISALAAAQQPNGYVNALITVRKMTPWANLDGQHDGYVAGHLIEAAVAHHLATGKTNFLEVARRLAGHIYQRFIVEQHEGVCGHAELELALVRLYRVTGQRRDLELAQDWIERRGRSWRYTTDTPRSYFMDHLPIRQVNEITGHAVRSLFYATAVADVGAETGDAGLREAARRLWRSVTQRKMYITGSVGTQKSDEGFGPDYDLPNTGYAESCAACGLLYFGDATFRLDGEAESIDVLERVLYNAVLHGISLDGTNTYYCNPLTDADHARDNCWVCCPPCLSRTLLRVPGYLYAQTDRDLYVNLYAASRATVRLKETTVRLSTETRYPWDGAVKITLTPENVATFSLRLRVPAWCRQATLRFNGAVAPSPRVENGYATLTREWRAGDVVKLDLPMPVERIEAHPRVQADAGRVALQRGPIVFGLEGVDNAGNLSITLPADPQLRAAFRPELLGGITVITGRATDGRPFTAIPFYALANRGKSQQKVWLRQAGKTDEPDNGAERLYQRWEPKAE